MLYSLIFCLQIYLQDNVAGRVPNLGVLTTPPLKIHLVMVMIMTVMVMITMTMIMMTTPTLKINLQFDHFITYIYIHVVDLYYKFWSNQKVSCLTSSMVGLSEKGVFL